MVKDNCLYYFKGNEDEAPCGIVPLSNVEARLVEPEHRCAARSFHRYRTLRRFSPLPFPSFVLPAHASPPHFVSARRFSTRKGKERGAQEHLLFELVGKPDANNQRLPIRGCKTNSKGVVVQGNHSRYLFRATSEAEANDWVRSIK